MRASMGRVALVGFLSLSFTGCHMGMPSFPDLAWWHKKPDNSALTEAPKYNPATVATTASSTNPANPAFPSAGQNPLNSLTAVSPSAYPANAAPSSATAAGIGATPASYQSSVYPTTPYGPAKLGASAPAATSNPWSGGVTSASSQPVYGASNPTAQRAAVAAAASMPSYAAAAGQMPPAGSSASGVQPQTGFYNPAYGGAPANRYASGEAIPGMVSAAAPQATGYAAPPNNTDMSNYRMADARNAASAGISPAPAGNTYNTPTTVAPAGGNASNSMAAASALVGDRYAGALLANPNSAAPAGPVPQEYHSAPSAYDSGNTNYQPAATIAPGNTGYNPTGVYSPPSGVGSTPASAMPARSDQEYRPGGTSNYIPTSGTSAQPVGNGTGTDSQGAMSGVRPASYQEAATGNTHTATLASATTASPSNSSGNEMYGSYQGTGSAGGLNSNAEAAASSAAAPVNTSATAPALLPSRPW